MNVEGRSHIRIARPSKGLAALEEFYVQGLGLSVIWRSGDDHEGHDLLMVGWPDAGWHLELVYDAEHPVLPQPTEEDLLVVYLDGPVPDELVARIEANGGKRVQSPNPYWNEWGVTLEDPDGYRLVLSTRAWSNA